VISLIFSATLAIFMGDYSKNSTIVVPFLKLNPSKSEN